MISTSAGAASEKKRSWRSWLPGSKRTTHTAITKSGGSRRTTLEHFLQDGSNDDSLDFRYNYIGDAGATALAASSHLANLQYLDISDNAIGEAGAVALAASPHLEKLQHLDLSRNAIGDAGAVALAASPHLTNLQHLDLGGNYIGDAGAVALAASPHLTNLQHLDLTDNYIRDAGATALAASPNLANLQHLDLYYNRIGDDGVRALASSPYLKNLQRLEIGYNITDTEEAGKLTLKRKEVVAAPAHEEEAEWRLLAYACLSMKAQAPVIEDFLSLAGQIHTSDPKGIGWRWCLQHMLTWTGFALEQAAAAFPDLLELQNRLAALQAEHARLEAALF